MIMKSDCRGLDLTWFFYSFMIGILISCNQDEKPQSLPIVLTADVVDITTTSAVVGGEIVDGGNSKILGSGVVYSSIVSEPTLADDVVVIPAEVGFFFLP